MSIIQDRDCAIHILDESLPSSDNREVNTVHIVYISDDDASEASRVSPRVGDQYQAELPQLIREQNHISYKNDEQSLVKFMHELPISLTWTKCHEHEGPHTISNSENSNNVVENGDVGDRQKCCHKGDVLVPGLPSASWSDAEMARFLVALYIFQRNFVEVRRFVETKNMGAILAFYYGDFYKSNGYKKWLEGRKSSKKCVIGEKIFLGLRQQELLSRLIPRVPEECKSGLVEVCTTFMEGKSLADFVSTLKTLVGTDTLVEAICIGKGKQDLSRMVSEHPKASQTTYALPEIPTGKACSSLTTTEIVRILNGDYRLSKTRSNDLFWEAVWPRLLARGWNSEQPHNQVYNGGSKFLVFLMPGVNKNSKRKLVKGDDYFDSIADVLSKVAKEPELIELKDAKAEEKTKDKQNLANVEKDEQPAKQQHFYLQPMTPTQSLDAIKFTIVDTSLSDDNIRELRTLPSQASDTLIYDGPCEDEESDDTTDIPTFRVDVSPTSETLRIVKCGGQLNANENKETRDIVIHSSTNPTLENAMNRRSSDVNECSGNLINSSEGSPHANNEPSQPQLLIDLNWPILELENDTPTIHTTNEPPIKQENQSLHAIIEEQVVANPRRVSTRYRPPTTRTLEAIASGFLSITRRRKSKDASSSRPLQRSRRGVDTNESPSSSAASYVEEAERGSSHDPPEMHDE